VPVAEFPALRIRAVLFDACGVVLHRSTEPHTPYDDLLWTEIGAGIPSLEAVSQRLAERVGCSPEQALALVRQFIAQWRADEDIVALIQRLHRRFRIGMVTNAERGTRFLRVHQFAAYGLDSLFDVIVISAEEGTAKPDPGLYRVAARRLGVPCRHCLFIDDRIDNVMGALDVGMAAFQHTSTERTIRMLNAIESDIEQQPENAFEIRDAFVGDGAQSPGQPAGRD
jgi:HAD superfamily hydrolase (TIGR01509 family)